MTQSDTAKNIAELIADDAFAASFQSMGQYRTALIASIAFRGSSHPAPCNKVTPADPQLSPESQNSEDAEVLYALHMACEHDMRHQADALLTWLPRIAQWCERSQHSHYLERELNALRAQSSPQPEPRRQEAKADGETPIKRVLDDLQAKLAKYEKKVLTEFGRGYEKGISYAKDTLERELNAALTQPSPVHEYEYDTTPRAHGGLTVCNRCGKDMKHPIHATQPSLNPSQGEWKWVPIEVTNAMQHAYFEVIDSNRTRVETDPLFGRYANHRAAYKAMLAASPSTDSPTEEWGDFGST